MKGVISVDSILDWNMHMLVKQSILQDISKSKKLNLTQEMIDEAKAESKKLLHSLLISKLPDTPGNKAVLAEMFEVKR